MISQCWGEQKFGLVLRSCATEDEGEFQEPTGEKQAGSSENLEPDRDCDGERARVRGGPETRGDLDEGHGH